MKKLFITALFAALVNLAGCVTAPPILNPKFNDQYMPNAKPGAPEKKIDMTITSKTGPYQLFWTADDNILFLVGGTIKNPDHAMLIIPSTGEFRPLDGAERENVLASISDTVHILSAESKTGNALKNVWRGFITFLAAAGSGTNQNFSESSTKRYRGSVEKNGIKFNLNITAIEFRSNNQGNHDFIKFSAIDDATGQSIYGSQNNVKMDEIAIANYFYGWNLSADGLKILDGPTMRLFDVNQEHETPLVSDYSYVQGTINPAWNRVALLRSEKKENAEAANFWIEIYPIVVEVKQLSLEDKLARQKKGAMAHAYTDPTLDMPFALVKSGCFEMGDVFGDGHSNEKPPHEVCLSDYYVAKYEVTQSQWQKIVGDNPADSDTKECGENCPVDNVSWKEVQDFIAKLNQISGKPYRLPTEAEWEFAARSRGKKHKWSGTNSELDLTAYSWYKTNSDGKVHPVGELEPNLLGIYDMSGNVREWVQDVADWKYYYSSPKENPTGPEKAGKHVLRGCNFDCSERELTNSQRRAGTYNQKSDAVGFRLALPAQ